MNKDYIIFNYYKLIKNKNNIKEEVLNHFFVTNNIAESFHSKLNYYIPKRRITSIDFLKIIKNIIEINNKIVRKDFITRTLISLASIIKNEKDFF